MCFTIPNNRESSNSQEDRDTFGDIIFINMPNTTDKVCYCTIFELDVIYLHECNMLSINLSNVWKYKCFHAFYQYDSKTPPPMAGAN